MTKTYARRFADSLLELHLRDQSFEVVLHADDEVDLMVEAFGDRGMQVARGGRLNLTVSKPTPPRTAPTMVFPSVSTNP